LKELQRMTESEKRKILPAELSGISIPLMWPMLAAAQITEEGLELYARNLIFVEEEIKIHHELRLNLATANSVMLDLRTMFFRDYSMPAVKGLPAIVDAP
jgi:poly(3-hydroxybutyrate) depolymerase